MIKLLCFFLSLSIISYAEEEKLTKLVSHLEEMKDGFHTIGMDFKKTDPEMYYYFCGTSMGLLHSIMAIENIKPEQELQKE